MSSSVKSLFLVIFNTVPVFELANKVHIEIEGHSMIKQCWHFLLICIASDENPFLFLSCLCSQSMISAHKINPSLYSKTLFLLNPHHNQILISLVSLNEDIKINSIYIFKAAKKDI